MMLLRLALKAGGDAIEDPDAFRERISNKQFAEWMAYYSIDPWDGIRGDVSMGIVASTIANVNRNEEKRSEPFRIDEFMHDWTDAEEVRARPTAAELDAKIGQFSQTLRAAKRGSDNRNPGAQDHGGGG